MKFELVKITKLDIKVSSYKISPDYHKITITAEGIAPGSYEILVLKQISAELCHDGFIEYNFIATVVNNQPTEVVITRTYIYKIKPKGVRIYGADGSKLEKLLP